MKEEIEGKEKVNTKSAQRENQMRRKIIRNNRKKEDIKNREEIGKWLKGHKIRGETPTTEVAKLPGTLNLTDRKNKEKHEKRKREERRFK